MAFVVVQHLSPDFKSLMDELLARHTELPDPSVEDGMPVEADHVYLIPPKKEMIISGGRLLLSERDRQQELTLPIDVFFRSLAQDCGRARGRDRALGRRQRRLARHPRRPRGRRPGDRPGRRERAVRRHAADRARRRRGATACSPRRTCRGCSSSTPPSERAASRRTAERATIEPAASAPSTGCCRTSSASTSPTTSRARSPAASSGGWRWRAHRTSRSTSGASSTSASELDVLYRDLLIGVTRFFRDEEAFEVLEQQVLPELLRREPRDGRCAFWVAGCATGEEAYSLAILLQDLMSKLGERPVKIFATDVHRGSLEQATRGDLRRGGRGQRLARSASSATSSRSGDTYQVVPELRQMVVFAPHNVIKDAPFTRVDLITLPQPADLPAAARRSRRCCRCSTSR